MTAKILVCLLLIALFHMGIPGAVWSNADDTLVIEDLTKKMPADMYKRLVEKTRSTMNNVREYWAVDQRSDPSGVILVEFVRSVYGTPSTFFFFRQENGRRTKVVRVYGGGEAPHQLAHKLTSALFPHRDKLIRNMMGEASERKFGNSASFPMCGAGVDEWAAALIQTGSYIPLGSIGTSHEDWGMEIVNNVPVVKDRKKQHASYIEAGSFGQYLLDSFGQEKMKEFYRRTQMPHRPWREVFGYTLDELERRWLARVKQKTAERPDTVTMLAGFWQKDPKTACYQVQK